MAMRLSMRASAAPRQLWMPYPKPEGQGRHPVDVEDVGLVVEALVPGGRTGDQNGRETGGDGHAARCVDSRTEKRPWYWEGG